jgi:hypothetical protein
VGRGGGGGLRRRRSRNGGFLGSGGTVLHAVKSQAISPVCSQMFIYGPGKQ